MVKGVRDPETQAWNERGGVPSVSSESHGIAEVWGDSADDGRRGLAAPAYEKVIRPDEEKRLDLPSCVFMVTEAGRNSASARPDVDDVETQELSVRGPIDDALDDLQAVGPSRLAVVHLPVVAIDDANDHGAPPATGIVASKSSA